ncbi:MAG: glycogen synthase GlgA [Treponemataceae bacterium]
MKILMITSEALPFAKSGGLADVVSSLSKALVDSGHEVKVLMPRYYRIDKEKLKILDGPMGIPSGFGEEWTAVYTTQVKTSKSNAVDYYFLDCEKYYGRDGIYGTSHEPDFTDNPVRFSILCQGAFQLCRKLGWYPDIMHAHDWATALVPVLLKFYERKNIEFSHTASIFTIHNLGYQGIYNKGFFPATNVEWLYYYSAGFEYYDNMNFLKAGIQSADLVTTVSPTYAGEIQTPSMGFSLDSLLRYRCDDLYGILNGIDTDIWNPETDKYIPKNFTAEKMEGKAACKKALQERFGLEVNPDIPVIGMVTRLAEQKGIAEIFAPTYGCCYQMCTNMKLQFVILGSGEKWCEHEIGELQSKLPNLRAYFGYNEEISHLIEAGSDFFMMPSRYEPCGSNQIYSMLYGTLPIVRSTGGLADTVENYNEKTGDGTGFMLMNLTPQSVYDTTGWAVWTFYNKKDHIKKMQKKAMKQDFSWKKSATEFVEVYQKALKKI